MRKSAAHAKRAYTALFRDTGMSASLLPSFDSRRDQLNTDESTASPVLLNYDYMRTTNAERRRIREARREPA